MISKLFITLIAALLSFSGITLAEEPSFPYPTEDEFQNQYIVEFEQNQAGEASKKKLISKQNDEREPKIIRRIESRNISVVKFPSKRAAGRWMERTGGIKFFERDSAVYLQRLSSNQGTRNLAETTPYGIGHVQAEDVPDTNSGSRKVCIIDSGYDRDHEDLPKDPSLVTGVTFVGSSYPWYEDDNEGHGTHVAGTIAAIGGNNKGVKGVIRNGLVKIHAVRVFPPSGSTSTSIIIDGFEECVQAGANVINMSLGGGGASNAFQNAITDAHNQGILVFAASGNTGWRAKQYPASYDHVISVASITESYQKSSFSTYNDAVDIAAPGSDVLSTLPGNNYAKYSGTSMACPHAAGVAALVWSNFPTLPAATIISTLEATALDLPLNSNDGKDNKFGHGLIQAKAAYDALSALNNSPTVSPAPSAMPVEFCADGVKVKVDVRTDGFGSETSWEITDSNGNVVASDYTFTRNAFTSDTFCLDKTATCEGSDYTFTIYDEFGDGICCQWGNGYYEVYVEGERAASGASFGSFESTSLCGTEPPTPTCDFSGRNMCNNEDGCYWFPNDRECYTCSSIPGQNKCIRFECTWNGSSCE